MDSLHGCLRAVAASGKLLVLLAATLAFAFLASPRAAFAHAPIYLDADYTSPDTAMPLGDPSSPGLIYGTLLPGGAQYVSFDLAAGQPFHAMVLGSLRGDDMNATLAFVGPGLGDPSNAPFAVPDGDGVLYVNPPAQSIPIFIADLGLRFLAGASYDGPLGDDGSYYLVVFSADGSWGNYTVGTGYGR